MNDELSQETRDTQFVSQLAELSWDALIKYAVLQVLRLQTIDQIRFQLAVESLESLIYDQLLEEQETMTKKGEGGEGYIELMKATREELESQLGETQGAIIVIDYRLSQAKFRRIMRFLNRQIPKDVVGVL